LAESFAHTHGCATKINQANISGKMKLLWLLL